MNRLAALQSIAAEVERGELSFPTSVAVALKIREALDDPDCHMEAAARLVQAEPLLSARVVAMANSVALNRSGRTVSDVRSAVTRLGFSALRSLAMALVARQMAGPAGTPAQQRAAAQLWTHTAHMAALARVIARRVSGQNPETALFAGLVHEVGGFYLLSRAAQYPVLLEDAPPAGAAAAEGDPDDMDDPEAELERGLTLAVLRRLAVPQQILEAITAYGEGYLALPPASLADTLLLANHLAPVRSPLRRGEADGEAGDIALQLSDETLAGILQESAEEVESLTRALDFGAPR